MKPSQRQNIRDNLHRLGMLPHFDGLMASLVERGDRKSDAEDAAWAMLHDDLPDWPGKPPVPKERASKEPASRDPASRVAVIPAGSSDYVDRTPGKRSIVQDAEWAYQHLDDEDLNRNDAPSAGAWRLLQRAKADPSILDAPLMLAAKRREEDDADEVAIRRDCTKTEGELAALIDRLLQEPL